MTDTRHTDEELSNVDSMTSQRISGLTDTVRKLQRDGGSAQLSGTKDPHWHLIWDTSRVSGLMWVRESCRPDEADAFSPEDITGEWIWEPEP